MLPTGAATIISAALMLAAEQPPAHASVALKAAPIKLTTGIAEAGGAGQARAYWIVGPEPAKLGSMSVTARAPEDQVFQPAGSLLLRTSTDGSTWVTLPGTPTLDDSCVLGDGNRSVSCSLPGVDLDSGTYYSVGFATFVAPDARITSEPTTTSSALLDVEGARVEAALQTFVGSRSSLTNRVVQPACGERTIQGQAFAGSTITLTGDSGLAGNTTSDADGNWSIALPEGFGAVQPRFIDVAGQEHSASPIYYNSYTFTASATDANSRGIEGQGQPRSRVDVLREDGAVVVSTDVDAAGKWKVSLPTDPAIGDGAIVVNAISDGTTTRLYVGGLGNPPAKAASPTLSAKWASPDVARAKVRMVIVTLVDGLGRPITGEVVRFSVRGAGDVTATTALTDHRGQATMTVASHPRAGYALSVEAASADSAITLR
jgi:hypothetical protein